MLTALRAALRDSMAALSPRRRPALRRADSDAWLLCTDLPGLISPEQLDAYMDALRHRGWACELCGGWLYVDTPLPAPALAQRPALTGEATCLASLLERHPDPWQDEAALRALCKAQEQGSAKTERLCRALHGQYAQRLRSREPLPGLLLPYLYQIAKSKEE